MSDNRNETGVPSGHTSVGHATRPLLQDRKLLKWYMERAQEDEHFNIGGFEKRIRFFSGLHTAILAAVVAGYINAVEWSDFLVLLIGPALMLGISLVTWQGLERYYNRFIDAIIIKAHIEQALGLTRTLGYTDAAKADKYWVDEPLVPKRHLGPRIKYKRCIDSWRDEATRQGSRKFVRRLIMLYFLAATVVTLVLLGRLMLHDEAPGWAAKLVHLWLTPG